MSNTVEDPSKTPEAVKAPAAAAEGLGAFLAIDDALGREISKLEDLRSRIDAEITLGDVRDLAEGDPEALLDALEAVDAELAGEDLEQLAEAAEEGSS